MEFFVLDNTRVENTNGASVTDFTREDGFRTGEPPRCAACGLAIGPRYWLPPFRARIEAWGERYGDIVFGPGNDLLVSERFKDVYLRYSLKGLDAFGVVEITKVVSHKRMKSKLPVYYAVRVSPGETEIDEVRSEIEYDKPLTCLHCKGGSILKRALRIVIKTDTWPGEDIFYPIGLPGRILVTKTFKTMCEREHLENCMFVKASEFSFDFYPWEKQRSD